jgi:hypothetical protein
VTTSKLVKWGRVVGLRATRRHRKWVELIGDEKRGTYTQYVGSVELGYLVPFLILGLSTIIRHCCRDDGADDDWSNGDDDRCGE